MVDLGNIGTVSNGETWTEMIEFIDEETSDPFDLSGIVDITIKVNELDGSGELNGSYTDTVITIPSDGVIGWTFTVDQMRALDPGEYELGITAEFSNETLQMCKAKISIVDRIVD